MMNRTLSLTAWLGLAALMVVPLTVAQDKAKKAGAYDPTAVAMAEIATLKVGKLDWPQWGGSSGRNNTPQGVNIPITWDIDSGKNIKWQSKLGSQTYGNPVAANGKIIEINANPQRLDMDWRHWRKAADKGVLACINPDAHAVEHFDFVEAGIHVARKGVLQSREIFNTSALNQIRERLAAMKP